MSVLDTARAFLEKAKNLTGDALSGAYKELSSEVKREYKKLKRDALMATPLTERREEHLSPSGKYKLVVTPFKTGENSWNYTEGLVFRQGSDTPIARVARNYSAFPFLWIDPHPNGKSFLVAGEDYQGQTVIELDTGNRVDHLPSEAEQGFGFCWAEYKFDSFSKILTACGCHWACPYEFRFYDFADPMAGWPEIKSEECIDEDEKWPVIEYDGTTIRSYQTHNPDDDDDDDDGDEPKEKKPSSLAAKKTFSRDGLKLVLVEEWASDDEKERRRQREEGNRAFDDWLKNFRATDPLYLSAMKMVKDPPFCPNDHDGIGTTYKDWCPDFQGQERRICRRILKDEKDKGKARYTIDLEWAADTGPIKLVIFKDGNSFEHKFFEHSVEGMNKAFSYAREISA